MMEGVEKQLEVIEQERRFIRDLYHNDQLQVDVLVHHQFVSRFPSISAKIKEENAMMLDALEDAKASYDKYKDLINKVKTIIFQELQKI